jgi:hypothetical protein
LDISFEEWRDFLLFHPSGDLKSIIAYWSHPPVSYKLSGDRAPPFCTEFFILTSSCCNPKLRILNPTVQKYRNCFFRFGARSYQDISKKTRSDQSYP